MTVLVGIHCGDGIVIAADRQATHGMLSMKTIGQEVTKITCPGGLALFASSGPIGIGQQVADAIEEFVPEFSGLRYAEICGQLQEMIRQVIEPSWRAARSLSDTLALPDAIHEAVTTGLLAFRSKERMHLVGVGPEGTFEEVRNDLRFMCHGSGKQSADPIIGYLKEVFFQNTPISLAEASLLAYWTVKVTIGLRADGAGMGIDVFSIRESDGGAVRVDRQLDHETKEGFIQVAQEAWQALRDQMSLARAAAAGVEDVPPPPTL